MDCLERKVLKTVCDNYIPRTVVNEFLSAKNEEINWLKEEIQYLRCKLNNWEKGLFKIITDFFLCGLLVKKIRITGMPLGVIVIRQALNRKLWLI